MARTPLTPARPVRVDPSPEAALDNGFRLVIALAAICGVLLLATLVGGLTSRSSSPGGASASPTAAPSVAAGSPGGASASAKPAIDVAAYLDPVAPVAPPIELVDQDGRPFSLASLRGQPVLIFFGYTHCPDVCPATVGTIGRAMAAYGPGVRALFVTIDPERDTTTWMREYVGYLQPGFTGLTGTADQIRTAADAWGVKYARVDTGVADGYAMSHTADVFLVDGTGLLRARFPFGAELDAFSTVLHYVVETPPPANASPSPTVTPLPTGTPVPTETPRASEPASDVSLRPTVVSSSVWAGRSPVILALDSFGTRLNDPGIDVAVQLRTLAGEAVGQPVDAVAVQPPGVATVSFVATLDIPSPGWWGLTVTARIGERTLTGAVDLAALDPGTTAAIGQPAPTIATPTLDDVGGLAKAVTTDPAPDLRLSRRSTTDALASHEPFVLVIDSPRFRVSPACGRAVILARYLIDRWGEVGFIHLEPYRYSIITDTPVLDGSLADPTLTGPADAWGIGGSPWGARSMPWVFVVDDRGNVRAKYQGIVGSEDVDVILSLLDHSR